MEGTFSAPVWSQLELLQHGYRQVMLEFTIHLDADSDQLLVGAALVDLVTREPIALEAFPFTGALRDTTAATNWMRECVEVARDRLTPFP